MVAKLIICIYNCKLLVTFYISNYKKQTVFYSCNCETYTFQMILAIVKSLWPGYMMSTIDVAKQDFP